MGEFNQKKYIQQYVKEHYKRFIVNVPIELNNSLEKKLKELNLTKSQFLRNSIEEILKK